MAQSYQDYIKSLKPYESTPVPVPSGKPIGLSGYVQPSTANSGSTPTTPILTPTQIVQQATSGLKPQSTTIPNQTPVPQEPNQTPVPQTYRDIINTTVPAGSTLNYDVNQYRTTNDPIAGYSPSPNTPGVSAPQEQPKTLSSGESANIAKNSGLSGIVNNNAYTGLTMYQAQQKAAEDKALRQGQVSANTSYTYNPKSISGFNDTFKTMRTGLDTIKNDAFTSTQQKQSDTNALIKSYTSKLADQFSSPEEFQSALSNSPEIQNAVAEFQRAGGQLSDIASSIGQKAQQNTQTLDQYLGRLSTPAEQQAYQSLIPEQKAYQDQISFEQSVPEQYKNLYFGTPERMGILEQERSIAQEKAALLETQAQMAKDNAKAQAEFLIQKNQADLAVEEANIEENRLNSKNYVTGMLAKLGALNTTGAAVEGLANLEQKYQRQAQQLRTTYSMKGREIEMKLNETLNDYDSKKQEAIIKVKEDLSKSEVEVAKEIMKLETTAARETFKITDKYLSEFRSQKEKYVKEAKAQAEKNAKASAALASSYDLSGLTFANYVNQQQQGGQPTKIGGSSILAGMDVTQGGQTFANPQTLFPSYLQALQGKNISDDLKAVLAGESKLSDYTPTDATKIQRELTKLGIKKSDLSSESNIPEVGTLLKEAKAAIESGKDKNAVRQKFLEAYPEKSAAFNAYFE